MHPPNMARFRGSDPSANQPRGARGRYDFKRLAEGNLDEIDLTAPFPMVEPNAIEVVDKSRFRDLRQKVADYLDPDGTARGEWAERAELRQMIGKLHAIEKAGWTFPEDTRADWVEAEMVRWDGQQMARTVASLDSFAEWAREHPDAASGDDLARIERLRSVAHGALQMVELRENEPLGSWRSWTDIRAERRLVRGLSAHRRAVSKALAEAADVNDALWFGFQSETAQKALGYFEREVADGNPQARHVDEATQHAAAAASKRLFGTGKKYWPLLASSTVLYGAYSTTLLGQASNDPALTKTLVSVVTLGATLAGQYYSKRFFASRHRDLTDAAQPRTDEQRAADIARRTRAGKRLMNHGPTQGLRDIRTVGLEAGAFSRLTADKGQRGARSWLARKIRPDDSA